MRFVNHSQYRNGITCEIGCGLGDIIRNLNAKEKIAYDISPEVIRCAKKLNYDSHNNNGIKYHLGSFRELSNDLHEKIDLLITINFIHGMSPDQLKAEYDCILSKKGIRAIIVDSVEGYTYHHDFDKILPDWYVSKVIGNYGQRKVLLEKK